MKKKNTKTAVLSLMLLGLLLAAAIGLIAEYLHLYVPGIWKAMTSGDQAALESCLNAQDRVYSAILLWVLSYVQVLSIFIPSMPIQLVAGMTFGTWLGFFINLTGMIAAHMTAFGIGRHAIKALRSLAEDNARVKKVINSLSFSRNRTYYTAMAILVPALPNGAIPYAAANSGLKGYLYLAALLVALPLPAFVTCLTGRLVLAGNFLVGIGIMMLLYIVVGVLFLFRNTIPDLLRKQICRLFPKLASKIG